MEVVRHGEVGGRIIHSRHGEGDYGLEYTVEEEDDLNSELRSPKGDS